MITSKQRGLSAGSNHERSKSKDSGFDRGFKSRKLPNLLLWIPWWDFLEGVVWGFREENRGVGLWFSRKVFASGAGGNSLIRVAMCKYRRERER
jgi:hypothetical protein